MILTKSEYIEKINSLLQDNSTQLISPLDLRISLRDLTDSIHLFTDGSEIVSANFATPDTRTTLAGKEALSKLKYAGRSSVDNSAFGYYSLGANHEGAQNTAIGSHSLGCNLHGTYNTAVGFNSIAGNTVGSGNTAIGSLALQSARTGSFNIAIGHGAGSHIPTDHSYKFFLGIDPIDSGYDCQDFSAVSGTIPLMYGDLLNRKLAVGIQSTHNHATLQTSGDISPSHSGFFNVGNSHRPWNSINEIIFFSGAPQKIGIGTTTPSGDQGLVTVNGSIVPNENGIHSLGWSDGTTGGKKLLWDGYFNDIVVSGNARINDLQYHTINDCLYDCKTLHLATSGVCSPDDTVPHNDQVCGYLSDEMVDGGGFVLHSSGYDYQRDYQFIFRNSDPDIKCMEDNNHFSRSRWQSNISLEIASGCHLQTDRVLFDESLSLVRQSGCDGIFTRPVSYTHSFTGFDGNVVNNASGSRTIVGQEKHIDKDYNFVKKSNVSFIADSGTHQSQNADGSLNANYIAEDYSVAYASPNSGIKISQKFLSRVNVGTRAAGFAIVYHDDLELAND